jgi:hypothetical protein
VAPAARVAAESGKGRQTPSRLLISSRRLPMMHRYGWQGPPKFGRADGGGKTGAESLIPSAEQYMLWVVCLGCPIVAKATGRLVRLARACER